MKIIVIRRDIILSTYSRAAEVVVAVVQRPGRPVETGSILYFSIPENRTYTQHAAMACATINISVNRENKKIEQKTTTVVSLLPAAVC